MNAEESGFIELYLPLGHLLAISPIRARKFSLGCLPSEATGILKEVGRNKSKVLGSVLRQLSRFALFIPNGDAGRR